MKHQGCLAIGEDLTPSQNWYYVQRTAWHSTLVHEIAHEWWGNSVSVSDMADAWLQEGFATYSEMLLIQRFYGMEAYKKSVAQLRSHIDYEYPVVGNRDVNENTFINGDIYFRGAWVIHELRKAINNDQVFFNILYQFQLKFRKKTVTTQDFIDTVNEISGKDYTDFLKERLYKT